MQNEISLLTEDFLNFSIGAFPYDKEHSAMGEYHYFPAEGYLGQWYDPIVSFNFKGPTWIVTEQNGKHYMEQMRVGAPVENGSCPTLVAGQTDWTNYQVTVTMKPLTKVEPCGLLFRYQTSLMHYALYLNQNKLQLYKIVKSNRTLLSECEFFYDCDSFYNLSVSCEGDTFLCYVNNQLLLTAADDTFQNGCIALAAYMPTVYGDVHVKTDKNTYQKLLETRKQKAQILAKKKSEHAQPKLWKIIDLKNFGAGRQIRFGHLTGTDEMFFVICQHQKKVFKDRYATISCMTAVSIETGEVLWQIGEPTTDAEVLHLTADLPFQIYDIDNDGVDEVIMAKDFMLMILDGKTGKIKHSAPTPKNDDDAKTLCGIEYGKHAFERLNVDSIRIVNVRGKDRPSDILIKDRYARIWVYDEQFRLLWKFTHNNTGHFPYAYDFNGDGKDEIFACYNMIDSNGQLVWKLPIDIDHTDEIIVGKMDPDRDEFIAIVSGWEGFMLVDKQGNIMVRDLIGHAQRVSCGNFCPKQKGMEICATTYWGNQGIIYLYDCKGNEIWHYEPSSNGNIIAPVNWDGDGTELILLNGNVRFGGMLDGDGDCVVSFPNDGHPDLACEVIDLTGDARDEIVLWDQHKMYIYTQDGDLPDANKEYCPKKYPHYNSSNYRGEYSFPAWIEKSK